MLFKEGANAYSNHENKDRAAEDSASPSNVPKVYFRSMKAMWYWATLGTAFATVLATFLIGNDSYPLAYIRWTLGMIFVVFLPGYSLCRSLQLQKQLNKLEFLCLSIGMSLALVSIFGLLLDQSPLGINLTTVTLGLLTITVILSTVAVIRDFEDLS